MKSTKKFWIGTLTAASVLLASLSAAQTFPTLKGDNQRTGRNATPLVSNPGRALLTWFRPNANDTVSGSIIRNNTATVPTSVVFTAGFVNAPLTNQAAFAYDQPPTGDPATDAARGTGTVPPYHYAFNGNALQAFTWIFDPQAAPINQPGTGITFARNYGLFVHLPIGSTSIGLNRVFQQRFFVYRINYGPGGLSTYIETVDTYAAGQGWVQLGNGGNDTNRMFQYDGITPIRVTLLNTIPTDANGVPTDTPGSSLVYADAAMAVPQVGAMVATPTVSALGPTLGPFIGRAISAVNRFSIGIREGEPVTISQGEVTSWNYQDSSDDVAPNGRQWTFRPIDQTFAVTLDNPGAAPLWTTNDATLPGAASALGPTYLTAPLVAGPATASVRYSPTLENGEYEIQMFLAPSTVTEFMGTAVQVEIHEGAAITTQTINMNRGPGWYTIPGGRYTHNQTDDLEFVVTNSGTPAATNVAYADAVRFVGAFDSAVNSTPVSARINVRQNGGGLVEQDVVIVASDDGHLYCLDAVGNGDGTTNVIWAYPSIPDATNPGWTDPNIPAVGAGADGQDGVLLAEMPIGFGKSSPIVQRIGGVDYVFVAAQNGRVYSLDASGRGDFNLATRRPGTTERLWSYPNDFPGSRVAGSLGSFTNTSIAYAEVGGTPRLYVPTNTGHVIALNPVGGGAATRDTNVLWDYPGTNAQLAPITTVPAIFNGRMYFGTTLDSQGVGHFYSINAETGSLLDDQEFIPAVGQPTLGAFFGGPAVVDGPTIGVGEPSTVFVSNNNLNVYALDATNINNVIWRTDELNTTVSAPLTFTPIDTFVIGGTRQVQPTIVVPGDNGNLSALFARGSALPPPIIGVTNRFGTKFAWGYSTPSGITAGTAVGAPPGAPGFLYAGDLSGNLFAFSNQGTIGGQGDPPIQEVIPPDDPIADAWRDAKIKPILKGTYETLRNNPPQPTHAFILGAATRPLPAAYEWGETAYFVVYDFPYDEALDGTTGVAPALVNFQISTEGATTRQFAVVARQAASAPAQRDGYAVLAFAIQGSGQNSLPPGRGRISYNVTPGRSSTTAQPPQVYQNPANFLAFQVANPIGMDMGPGINDEIAVTTLTNEEGALMNGTPNLASTPMNNETLLTASIGLVGHATTGAVTIRVYDRSWMTFLRGPNRGLDLVRVQRPEMEWLGGSAAIAKRIPTAIFGFAFEDLPDARPNVSLDYPNIRAENVRVTKDPNGSPENPGFSGVFLRPPLTGSGQPLLDELDAPGRRLRETDFLFQVDVPRFQPYNNSTNWSTSNLAALPIVSGYSGRVQVFVDSNNDGIMNTLSGRLEANRGFWLNGSVSMDEAVAVRTPNVDLGSLPGGAGYSPAAPTFAGSVFSPWPAGTTYPGLTTGYGREDFVTMFKHFTVENPGNVNLTNLRMAKYTQQGANPRLSWGIYSSTVDEFGWLDAELGLWSDIDSDYALTPVVILQKARVGDRGPSVLQTNPRIRENPNLGVAFGPFRNLFVPNNPAFNGIRFGDDPRVAVTLPVGFPVGTYSQLMRVIEDDNGDETLPLSASGLNALEAFSDPSFILSFKARESRLTNDFTRFTAPMTDDPGVLGTPGAQFLHQNLQPTAARVSTSAGLGHLLVAWTSNRVTDIAVQPTAASSNDRYRIYLAGLNGGGSGAGDVTNGVRDLPTFAAGGAKWFNASPSSTNGYPGPGYVFPTVAGETVVPGTDKYGSPVLPGKGQFNEIGGLPIVNGPSQFPNFDMAFIGDAQKQTPSGRQSESRLFTTRVNVPGGGIPTADAAPYPMPYDVYSQKGRPTIVRLGDITSTPANEDLSIIAYSALSAGNSRIFWTTFDYNTRTNATTGGYTQPQAIEFGEGFESVASPSMTVRAYTGGFNFDTDPTNDMVAVYDLSFTGKLRGRKSSEVFIGRLPFQDPSTPAYFPVITQEKLVPDTEVGLFRAKGIEWNMVLDANPNLTLPRLSLTNGVTVTPIEVPGSRRIDSQTNLIVIDTTLGGKAYIDPRMGTVRLSSSLPLSTQSLLLTYQPKFLRASTGTTAAYSGVSQFHDGRNDGINASNTKYWVRANGNGITSGDRPQVHRFWLSYNRAAAGAGQAARPFMKTMRLGVQLPYQIHTFPNGNISALTVTQFGGGAMNGFFQVDPVKGRVYFSPADEDRRITITFNTVDPSTGNISGSVTVGGAGQDPVYISRVSEQDEAPVPIEQAVNESNLYAFPDPFNDPNFARPNLVWMFWTSTRGGSPDLYFQTVAPRFAPQASGN